MRTNEPGTVPLGDLVAAAFDEAAYYSNDPAEVSHLAARTVMDLLFRARCTLLERIAVELAAWENEGGSVLTRRPSAMADP